MKQSFLKEVMRRNPQHPKKGPDQLPLVWEWRDPKKRKRERGPQKLLLTALGAPHPHSLPDSEVAVGSSSWPWSHLADVGGDAATPFHYFHHYYGCHLCPVYGGGEMIGHDDYDDPIRFSQLLISLWNQ